jgi:hypothetical protein
MSNRYYSNRRGSTYYEEKSALEKTSDKNLPAYIADLNRRWLDSMKNPAADAYSVERLRSEFNLAVIETKISQLKSNPDNRQFFGLFVKDTPALASLLKERQALMEELSRYPSITQFERHHYNQIQEDLAAVLKLAEKRFEKLEASKKRSEALKEKSNIISEYEDKSRKVAISVKKRLPINPICPYCGDDIGHKPHADHIYPVSKGGRSTASNMVYICQNCNSKKRNLTLREFIVKYNLNREIIEKNLESLGKSF